MVERNLLRQAENSFDNAILFTVTILVKDSDLTFSKSMLQTPESCMPATNQTE